MTCSRLSSTYSPCFYLPKILSFFCHNKPTLHCLVHHHLCMFFITFLKGKTEPRMTRMLWSHQDLQFDCLFTNTCDLGSEYLWEEIWIAFLLQIAFFFSDSISEMCGTIGEKSWTAREYRPEHIQCI